MSQAQSTATIAVTVHGPAGVLDLVVPEGAMPVDLAREYAAQAGLAGIPLLQSATGDLLRADRDLVAAGVEPGDVLVATGGVKRPTASRSERRAARAARPDTPGVALLVGALAATAAGLGAWYAAHAGDEGARTLAVGILVLGALGATLPVGRHHGQRAVVAPAFAAAAALAAVWVPGAQLLPTVVGVCALSAAAVAAVARAFAGARDQALTIWIATGVVVFAVCTAVPLLEWRPQVAWAVLVLLAVLAARFAPSLAVDVPDDALLDLDRLAVTAWSARDRTTGRRGRLVVPHSAMSALVARASRTVTAAAAAVLGVVLLAVPLLLRDASLDLDRIGARCLAFFAGASLLLAARSYRHRPARSMLRAAGLASWAALVAALVSDLAGDWGVAVFVTAVVLAPVVVASAVATGRGWRSVWWSRRAELAEALSGSFAVGATVVAAGLFRALWEITS